MVDDTFPHEPQAIERLRRWGGDKLVREMSDLFRRDVPVRLADARSALDRADRVTLERSAHSLKSSCAQLGAVHMQCLARELERAAPDQALAPLAEAIDALESAFASHVQWLAAFTSPEPQ